MDHFFILLLSSLSSFWGHHFGERFLTKNKKRSVRLVIKNYHVHHSIFGVLAIIAAFIAASSFATIALFGFGLGNIWQHKRAHNKANEKGLVFISKINQT